MPSKLLQIILPGSSQWLNYHKLIKCTFSPFKCNSLCIYLYSSLQHHAHTKSYRDHSPELKKHRNIGISAHIDSGKTTLTERILYYTGRISSIHDVRGKDGVGAKMDSMDLEREKGITIQSAATFCTWKSSSINIIDTPGHVDFTVEVERALRVLDGGIMVFCGVSGVQSQSLTVDRQMKRYEVPRLAFINKLDRRGCDPKRVVYEIRQQLGINAATVQVPIGLENEHEGVVDIIEGNCLRFQGKRGQDVEISDKIPLELDEEVKVSKKILIESLAEVDDNIAEYFLMEEDPPPRNLREAIRRAVLKNKFVPVYVGSAYKNKGIQPLLDGVVDYLPSPRDRNYTALDRTNCERPVEISARAHDPLLALVFKLEETPFGQLSYVRLYQGTIYKGQRITNVRDGKAIKLARIVRMHADEMKDIESASAGDVVAMFGVNCRSMDTISDGSTNLLLSSMHVPHPVMSLSIRPKESDKQRQFGKALAKFSKEDPTLKVKIDNDTSETILSGMGELHLDVYIERMFREYNVQVISGKPGVNYKETIKSKCEFNWLHRKQTGGSGQFARVIGYIEPILDNSSKQIDHLSSNIDFSKTRKVNEFVNLCVGTNIPPEYYSSCQKGTDDALTEGSLVGGEVQGVRVVLLDGANHPVDSSDLAFRTCMANAIRDAMKRAVPQILEPIMIVEADCPSEFRGTVVAGIHRRRGIVQSSNSSEDGMTFRVTAEVPLANMFGYATELRSTTQGKGEFTMEYERHYAVPLNVQEKLKTEYNLRSVS